MYRVDHDLVDALIAKKARVDVANEFGHTPLAEAVKQGDARMVKTLLGAGSGTEGANADGQTALMVAIKNGDLPIFQMLIDAGAKVNVVEKVQDQTPLMWAAAATRNAAEMVKVLIAKGATVNARARFNDWPSQITSEPRAQYHAYGGLTPLLYAARGGCYACVEALVAAGADVNLPTPEGVSPIMIALDNGHNGVAKFLMERGGNPHVWDVYGRTALYIAVGNAAAAVARCGGRWRGRGALGQVRGAAARLPAQARRRAAGPAGRSGSRWRARRARGGGQGGWQVARWRRWRGAGAADSGPQVSAMEMINLLLACRRGHQCATQHASSQQSGRTFQRSAPQHRNDAAAARADQQRHRRRAAAAREGRQSEHLRHGPFAMALCRRHYQRHVQCTRGGGSGGVGTGSATVDTALLDLMLKHGADVNAQVTGAASYSGRIARALTGDPVNTTSNEGMTALHVAVRSRNASFVRYLLDKGARTDIKDASGRTPLDVLNGVPAFQPAVFADADGVVPPNPNAAPAAPAPAGAGRGGGAGGRGGGNPAAVQEIRVMLQGAPQNQPQ